MNDRQRPTGRARTVARRKIGAAESRRKRIGVSEQTEKTSQEKPEAALFTKSAPPLARKPAGANGTAVQPLNTQTRPKPMSASSAERYVRKPVLETGEFHPKHGNGEKRFMIRDDAPFSKDKNLQFRHELKYYINYHDYVVLRQALKVVLSPDEHGGENHSYHIRSLYFDDRDNKALVEKLNGTDARNKYRIRIYNYGKNSVIRFENKIKRGQFIAKTSFSLTREEYSRILNGDYDFLKNKPSNLAKELYIKFTQDGLAPKVVVDYEREAYVHPLERIRITFDKNLRAGTVIGDIFNKNLPVMPVLEPGVMILEVKFNKFLPPHIQAVLNNAMAPTRSAISKYTLCRKYE